MSSSTAPNKKDLPRLYAPVKGLIAEDAFINIDAKRWKDQVMWWSDIDEKQGIVAPADGIVRWYPEKKDITFIIETETTEIHCGVLLESGFQSLLDLFKKPFRNGHRVQAGTKLIHYNAENKKDYGVKAVYVGVSKGADQIVMDKKAGPGLEQFGLKQFPMGGFFANVYKSKDPKLQKITKANEHLLDNSVFGTVSELGDKSPSPDSDGLPELAREDREGAVSPEAEPKSPPGQGYPHRPGSPPEADQFATMSQ